MLQSYIALMLATVFALLSLIHIFWAFGGQWGIEAALPRKADETGKLKGRAFEPRPALTFLVALVLLSIALLALLQGGFLRLPLISNLSSLWLQAACGAVGLGLLLRALSNKVRTDFC